MNSSLLDTWRDDLRIGGGAFLVVADVTAPACPWVSKLERSLDGFFGSDEALAKNTFGCASPGSAIPLGTGCCGSVFARGGSRNCDGLGFGDSAGTFFRLENLSNASGFGGTGLGAGFALASVDSFDRASGISVDLCGTGLAGLRKASWFRASGFSFFGSIAAFLVGDSWTPRNGGGGSADLGGLAATNVDCAMVGIGNVCFTAGLRVYATGLGETTTGGGFETGLSAESLSLSPLLNAKLNRLARTFPDDEESDAGSSGESSDWFFFNLKNRDDLEPNPLPSNPEPIELGPEPEPEPEPDCNSSSVATLESSPSVDLVPVLVGLDPNLKSLVFRNDGDEAFDDGFGIGSSDSK
ncbi:hypothetical protein OGAPHI_001215 [Ogataea philodendri]|uniref:Uncharacterized protein n=1 Tax=Ogataea philodendri TaxID=1378263 RepID=A0A9P8T9V5_9ASCO|nr:uncharacterized protein OGAPHI_001215 [Ogataea philodendri]KAH3670700.1 hypothetical protein OGAPHI_001215 [Ogataea philodendri]